MSSITLVPNYGRDYRSKAEVQSDWDANKDFRVQDMSSRWNGCAGNKQDLNGKFDYINIRYKKLTSVHVVKQS